MFGTYSDYYGEKLMKVENNNNITFQSKIKFINQETFKNLTANHNPKKHKVGWPWTADTMKKGKNLYTTGIMDCIAGGVVDGNDIVMFHLGIYNQAKAKKNHQKGFSIENFKRRILEKINLDNENLHGIILGGFQLNVDSKYNVNKLNKIKRVFDDNKIPYSIFGARKDVHYFGRYSLFYSNKEDTFYITNGLTGAKSLNGKNIEIDVKEDIIEYNTYKKEMDRYGVTYPCLRKKTGTKEFFESQFRQVSVCKLDELI